ncbi:MAG: ORC1-type DNA replication protein [Nanoarchaeota archaeon]
MRDGVTEYFENFLTKETLFNDKSVLTGSYVPEEIKHRDEQISQIAKILAPCLRLDKPSNLFIYGKTGTGKTLTIKHVGTRLSIVAKEKSIPLRIIYINCKLKKIADTEYRLIAELARFFGKAIPPTGLPTDEVYNIFIKALDIEEQTVLIILDEIDQLVKKTGDNIIYNLTRINADLHKAKLSLIGVSNDLMFANNLDPRVKSSLSEEELVFPPYNALQIQDILYNRARNAFKPQTIEEGVIPKCAAYAARDHGDARRALELLRVAAELAERNNEQKVRMAHIDDAEDKIERDRVIDAVKNQPKQFQLVLYAILLISQNRKESIFTGEVYALYKELCAKTGLRPLTQRRVSDVLAELDMFGIITAKVISKGRFGRTREISMSIAPTIEEKIKKILQEDLTI